METYNRITSAAFDVLMAPFVAIFGLTFNDVAFTLFFGALNAALMFLVLESLRDVEVLYQKADARREQASADRSAKPLGAPASA